jgi:hypothetical protein
MTTLNWHRTCMRLHGQPAGQRTMFTDMAGFFVGMALTLTLMVAICDLDPS